jgi:nascent polypeptide-associated complex subunit alpha
MLPGRMNPRQMERMMKKMGLNVEELSDVKEVIIRTPTKEFIVQNPNVTVMDIRGEKSFQVQGRVIEKELKEGIPESDVELVASQAGVSKEEARKALEETGGEPAEAIIKLIG